MASNSAEALYSDLNALLRKVNDNVSSADSDSDLKKALRLCEKLLDLNPADNDAIHCKIVAQMKLSQYAEALNTMEVVIQGLDLSFEKAYCMYKLHRLEEARVILDSCKPDSRCSELKAQVLYRLEKYDQSLSLYQDLMRNAVDDLEGERFVNYTAALAGAQNFMPTAVDLPLPQIPGVQLEGSSVGSQPEASLSGPAGFHELHYNAALHLIGKGRLQDALSRLQVAERLCRLAYDLPDGAPEPPELVDELASIRVQTAFVRQRLGKPAEALQLYQLVLREKPADAGVAAVAASNVISLNRDQNVFDSRKKTKVALSDVAHQTRLTLKQRQFILLNVGAFYLCSNQLEQCRKVVGDYEAVFGGHDDRSVLLKAALLHREKHTNKALSLLEEYLTADKRDVAESPERIRVWLVWCQLLLSQGHVCRCCEVMELLSPATRYRLGVVSSRFVLYRSQEEVDSAVRTLEACVAYWDKNRKQLADAAKQLASIKQVLAGYLLSAGRSEHAARVLEELRRQKPNDVQLLAQLIAAYAKFDSVKAAQVTKELPSIDDLAKSVDLSSVEASFAIVRHNARREGKSKEAAAETDKVAERKKKAKKKKRKIRLPKKYDPAVPPDPERWLPRQERSNYRPHRRDKRKDVGRGPQGSVMVSAELDASKAPAPAAAAAPSAPRPPASAKAKAKKKKGPKW